MLHWSAVRGVILHFIDPGKPTQNTQIESLNGRFRDKFLNANSFLSIYSARQLAAIWCDDYNESRPRCSLDYITPKAFAEAYEINLPSQLSVALKRPLRLAPRRSPNQFQLASPLRRPLRPGRHFASFATCSPKTNRTVALRAMQSVAIATTIP